MFCNLSVLHYIPTANKTIRTLMNFRYAGHSTVFSGTEQTSINLQSRNTSVQEVLSAAEISKSYLRRLRTDKSFKDFYERAVKQGETFTGKPTLPRYRRPPRRFHYFYALDLVAEEISVPDLVNAFKESQKISRLQVTSMRTIAEILNTVPLAKAMFSEIDKLLRLNLTIPVTTATAERSFSSLRCIKTYLGSTMSEERLNNIMLLHTQRRDRCS